jgi:hypothetical protein
MLDSALRERQAGRPDGPRVSLVTRHLACRSTPNPTGCS